jgi:hypothetical protein
MSKKKGGIFSKITKVVGSKLFDPLGINKKTGILTPIESMLAGETSPLDGLTGAATIRAAEATQKQQAALAAQQAVIQQNATQLQAQSAVDNTVNVTTGGSADAADSLGTDFKRRRTGSIASQLGV